MKGDFSRDTYDRIRHFSRVLQQQGRVQLDADWNEQAEILLHYVRTLAADLIGPFAGPAGEARGFEIAPEATRGLRIGRGRYYLDGILCENERAATYGAQDDFPGAPALDAADTYVVYLDVWEHHVGVVEDGRIREVALGGPDTATRTRVVWQVKADAGEGMPPAPGGLTPEILRAQWPEWIRRWQPSHLGCLRPRVKRPEQSDDPCLSAPEAKYRGAENQFYRVEIHRGGAAGRATFKWSRDNGSVVSRASLSGIEVIAETPRGFAAGHWVELVNDGQELRGRPGTLVKVIKVQDGRLTLESAVSVPSDVPAGEAWPSKVRRWDHRRVGTRALEDGAVPLTESAAESGWIDLEDGIQVQFLPASADGSVSHVYRPGDYWVFPARVATGDVEWPRASDGVTTQARPPRGVRHHYAPLAIVRAGAAGWVVTDCRSEFRTVSARTGIAEGHGEDGVGGGPVCGREP